VTSARDEREASTEPALETTGSGWSPGMVIDDEYRVERLLGEGGMGIVLAARHVRTDDLVAVKLIRPERAGDQSNVRRFMREARITLHLRSDHVARVLRFGRLPSGLPYLVMQYLEGGTLESLLREQGPLPVETAVGYVLQACEAVAEAHALGIVHRDLKPSNIFLSRDASGAPSIKVIDFGISKWATGRAQIEEATLTTTAAPLGSPRYMSPEQLGAASRADARSDLWALGVILFELVTGEHPFADDSLAGLCARILRDPAPSLSAGRPGVPAGLDAIYRQCLIKDPAQRMPSVADLAVALAPFGGPGARTSLARILSTHPGAGTTVAGGLPARPSRRWGRKAVVAALVVASAGAGVGIYAGVRPGGHSRTAPLAATHAPVGAAAAGVQVTRPAATEREASPPRDDGTESPGAIPRAALPRRAIPARRPPRAKHRLAESPAAPADQDLFSTRR
jgi:eukaryotic-like serine/threonine-protein kinase